MTGQSVAFFFVQYVVFLFSLVFHEAAHALVARLGGDTAASEAGYATLDPRPHLERQPFGLILVPVVSYMVNGYVLGWASVPYDPRWAARYPTRAALMSAAGPLGNFVLVILAVAVMYALNASGVMILSGAHLTPAQGDGLESPLGAVGYALTFMVVLNLMLGLFNLMPIPPLDGAGILEGLAPRATAPFFAFFNQIPMAGMFGVMAAWRLFDFVGPPIISVVFHLLF